MVELEAGFLGRALEVVSSVGAPIKRQFNYLCCFTSNIATLKDEAQKLDYETKGLQQQVDVAKNDAQIIVPAVETWITKSNDIEILKNTILDEVSNVESGCLKLRARFSLSKRSKKTTDHIKKLLGECKFDVISVPRPPTTAEAIPLGTTYEFESRKQIEEDIMTSLRDEDVNMIGICGMGGLGKTTMAKMIMIRALKEHVFEEVVMAVVNQPADKWKIPDEIGVSLGLDLKGETSLASRVQNLHSRLTASTKKILLVLDDVWERLELEKLGIPRGCKGCTILLTSRNYDVLCAMDVEKVFEMEILSEEDAWLLFRGRAGTCVDDAELTCVAKQVVTACRGLPIALSIVGAVLKNEKNVFIWEDARLRLVRYEPDIPNLIEEDYKPLKISYDKLESDQAKSLFLLCCLFGEDAHISVEKLTYFCMGLNIFEGLDIHEASMEEARYRTYTLIKMLKSRSLLLDGRNEDYVRMHDVIRDVCIFIAKEEGYIGQNNCNWISSFQMAVGGLLFLSDDSDIEEEFKLQDSSFLEGIRNLQVLFIQYNSTLTSLPCATQSLRNLNTLLLYSCEKLETISIVGELVYLEILVCCDCVSIKELPQEINGLNHLKLLDLSGCRNLERIGKGIISSLVGLEELKMLNSFNKWEACDRKERQNANASLRELGALINLRCLEIDIHDPAAENMHLSSNIKYLHLSGNGVNNVELATSENIRWLDLGECETMKNAGRTSTDDDGGRYGGPISSNSFENLKDLRLKFFPALQHLWQSCSSPSQINVSIFSELNSLYIYGCHQLCSLFPLSWPVPRSCLLHLEELVIESCDRMEHIFFWNEGEQSDIIRMQNLKVLILDSLPKLTIFCKGTESFEFPLLDRKRISRCPHLETLVSTDRSPDYDDDYTHFFCKPDNEVQEKMELKLQQNITLGNKIQEFVEYISLEEDGSTSFDFGVAHSMRCLTFREFSMGTKLMNMTTIATLFPLLEVLCLVNIKELEQIWDIDGPKNLNELRLKSLPALKHLWQISSNPSQMNVDVSIFNKLSCIYIYGCHRLSNLFPLSMMGRGSCLSQLESLVIESCEMMEQVFLWNEEETRRSTIHIPLVFPKLKVLKLDTLPRLISFCEGMESFEFPFLVEMTISRCLLLQNLVHDDDSTHLFCKRDQALWKIRSSLYQMNVVSIFNQISSICIYGCDGLLHLFSLSMMVRGSCLLQLERLEIESCKMMEQVFLWNEDNIYVEKFPELKFLSLSFLPKLKNICKGIELIQCPKLDKMKIINCPLLQSIVYWDEELPFIFNSLRYRSSQLERGKGAKTALQPQMLKKEEKQQQKEVGEQSNLIRKTTTEDEDEEGRKGEIEEEQNWKTTSEKEEGRKVEIEEEQNWKTTTKGGRKCEMEEEQN